MEQTSEENKSCENALAEAENESGEKQGSSSKKIQETKNDQRQKSTRWTIEEHRKFLVGLSQFGKGDWKSIAKYSVITKNSTQVASHAQKYFKRQNSSIPFHKRHPSIHDITTTDPSVAIPQGTFPSLEQEIPSHSTSVGQPPIALPSNSYQNYNAEGFIDLANAPMATPSTEVDIAQLGELPPVDETFSADPSIYFLSPDDGYLGATMTKENHGQGPKK